MQDCPGDGTANSFSAMPGKRRAILDVRAFCVAVHAWQMQQHREAGLALDQRADCRAAEAQNEVALSVTWDGPILRAVR